MHETADVRAATDEVNRSKAASEKSLRNLQGTLNELGKKIEEASLTLGDIEAGKRKLAAENADLLRQLQELENSANMLAKLKLNLADHDVAGMKDHFDEEVSAKENIGRQLSKAICEADMMRERYEKEGVAKAEELEMAKLKMQARLSEAESTADQLQAKLAQVEKAKSKISAEIESMAGQLDQAQILNSSMEKKAKQFDRIVGEWKQKVDGIGMDLDNAQKETRK